MNWSWSATIGHIKKGYKGRGDFWVQIYCGIALYEHYSTVAEYDGLGGLFGYIYVLWYSTIVVCKVCIDVRNEAGYDGLEEIGWNQLLMWINCSLAPKN